MLRTIFVVVLCFLSSLLGSLVTVWVMSPPEEEPAAAPGYLAAHELVLTDARGRTRVRLQGESFAGAPGGQIVFYDEKDVPRITLALDATGPTILLQSSELPDPDHKRVRLGVEEGIARVDIGHGELEEVVLKSGPATDPPANAVEIHARNGSMVSMFTDVFSHATFEVTDLTTKSLFRVPDEKPLLP